MEQMSHDEMIAFVSQGTRTGKLAVVRRDGRPHVTPIWFVVDGDAVVFTTAAGSVKGRALRRDPRVSIAIDDETPPFAFVEISGTATISEDSEELIRWATDIAARYMGEEKAATYGRRNGVPGELLVKVDPDRIVARKRIAD
jgi:PPOX class probable F420-dependent enzyme